MACRGVGIGNQTPELHPHNVPLIQCRTECPITPISRKITDARHANRLKVHSSGVMKEMNSLMMTSS
jgi:hypothetical protein